MKYTPLLDPWKKRRVISSALRIFLRHSTLHFICIFSFVWFSFCHRLDIDRSVRQTFWDDFEFFTGRFSFIARKHERNGRAISWSKVLLYQWTGRVVRAGAPSERARSRTHLQSTPHYFSERRAVTHKQYY